MHIDSNVFAMYRTAANSTCYNRMFGLYWSVKNVVVLETPVSGRNAYVKSSDTCFLFLALFCVVGRTSVVYVRLNRLCTGTGEHKAQTLSHIRCHVSRVHARANQLNLITRFLKVCLQKERTQTVPISHSSSKSDFC